MSLPNSYLLKSVLQRLNSGPKEMSELIAQLGVAPDMAEKAMNVCVCFNMIKQEQGKERARLSKREKAKQKAQRWELTSVGKGLLKYYSPITFETLWMAADKGQTTIENL